MNARNNTLKLLKQHATNRGLRLTTADQLPIPASVSQQVQKQPRDFQRQFLDARKQLIAFALTVHDSAGAGSLPDRHYLEALGLVDLLNRLFEDWEAAAACHAAA